MTGDAASLQEGARSAASAPWWPNQQVLQGRPSPQLQICQPVSPQQEAPSATPLPLSPAGLICKAKITAPYQNIFTFWGHSPANRTAISSRSSRLKSPPQASQIKRRNSKTWNLRSSQAGPGLEQKKHFLFLHLVSSWLPHKTPAQMPFPLKDFPSPPWPPGIVVVSTLTSCPLSPWIAIIWFCVHVPHQTITWCVWIQVIRSNHFKWIWDLITADSVTSSMNLGRIVFLNQLAHLQKGDKTGLSLTAASYQFKC